MSVNVRPAAYQLRGPNIQNVQEWDFEKFPIDLKKYNPIPLDPVKDKKLSEEQKKTLVGSDLL